MYGHGEPDGQESVASRRKIRMSMQLVVPARVLRDLLESDQLFISGDVQRKFNLSACLSVANSVSSSYADVQGKGAICQALVRQLPYASFKYAITAVAALLQDHQRKPDLGLLLAGPDEMNYFRYGSTARNDFLINLRHEEGRWLLGVSEHMPYFGGWKKVRVFEPKMT